MTNPWQARSYDADFGFVTALGRELVDELAVTPGEHVLDVGCGTGHLTAALAAAGAVTVGLDADPDMLGAARTSYPELTWVAGDAQALDDVSLPGAPFDAVISNAALHWMPRQADVLAGIRAVAKDGARFVAELGGAGNVAAADDAFRTALRACDIAVDVPTNFYPTAGQEATLLEHAGFRADSLCWFERPTRLSPDQTLVDWLRHFRAGAWARLSPAVAEEVAALVLSRGRELGLETDGHWHVDYCRLRFRATAIPSSSDGIPASNPSKSGTGVR